MNIEKIQQAITKLSPNELAHLRAWLNAFGSEVQSGRVNNSKQSIKGILKKRRGSLKGSGALKALMEERHKESQL